jgi:hypothetical protein
VVLLLQGGKLYLIIVYPNSRNTEVRARCCIRGVPQLGAANRLDLEELLSFDRDTNSSSSMLGSSGECQGVGFQVAATFGFLAGDGWEGLVEVRDWTGTSSPTAAAACWEAVVSVGTGFWWGLSRVGRGGQGQEHKQ